MNGIECVSRQWTFRKAGQRNATFAFMQQVFLRALEIYCLFIFISFHPFIARNPPIEFFIGFHSVSSYVASVSCCLLLLLEELHR